MRAHPPVVSSFLPVRDASIFPIPLVSKQNNKNEMIKIGRIDSIFRCISSCIIKTDAIDSIKQVTAVALDTLHATLLIPREVQHSKEIKSYNIAKNEPHHRKVLLDSLYLNGHSKISSTDSNIITTLLSIINKQTTGKYCSLKS